MRAEDKGNLLYLAAHTQARTTKIVATWSIQTSRACTLTHPCRIGSHSRQKGPTCGPRMGKDSLLLSVKALLPPPLLPPLLPSPPSSSLPPPSLSIPPAYLWYVYVGTRGEHWMSSSIPLCFVHWRQAISQNLDLGWWQEHPDDPAFLMPLAHMKLGLETCAPAWPFMWMWEIWTHVPTLVQWTLLP